MLNCKQQRGARKSKGLHHSKVKYPFIGSSTIHQGFFCTMCPYSAKGPSSEFKVNFFPICSGLYGVGKAAENPPALVVLSHTPASATRTIAWVGKGIVYDTGGLCIKAKVCSAVLYFMCPSAKQDKNHFILF